MPIVRRTDCIKPHVVLAWMCWLRLCGAETRAERTAFSSCPDSTQPQPAHPGQHHTRFYVVCSPDDGHNDARNMLRLD